MENEASMVVYLPRSYEHAGIRLDGGLEGARLGWICHVIVRDQFGCVPELCHEDPRGLLVGTGIPSPADKV